MRMLLIFALLTPLAAEDPAVSGSVEVGYRAMTDVAGSVSAYRSVVDLGDGVKLLGTEFTILDPKKRLFDRLDVRAYNWGDDPYSTVHLTAAKQRLYRLDADYRNIAYFNSLPSFDNPLLDRGVFVSQRSFDVRRKLSSFTLDLLPGRTITPYLAYDRSAESGDGVTTFIAEGNEYPLPERIRDSSNQYRGGIRVEMRRFHVTLEQGGITFRDDQRVFSSGGRNTGNTPAASGLFLTNLQQAYGIRGNGSYEKGLFSASPFSWVDVDAQFLYSQPKTDVNYQQAATGNFLVASQGLFYTGQQLLLSAASALPHVSGSFGVEVRPFRRLRVLQSWMTDRLHSTSNASSSQILTPATVVVPTPPQSARLVSNYSQEQVDVFFDVTRKLTLRGGYRHVWGEASTYVLPITGLLTPDLGEVRRDVGIGGFTFRPSQKISVSGDVESASGDRNYFRTSLNDYTKMRARGRYQAFGSLSFGVNVSLLDNQNPAVGVQNDYRLTQSSLSTLWAPQGGKRFTLQADYTRSTIRSSILYLMPQNLQPALSIYRENAHLATTLVEVALPGYRKLTPRLSAGGSLLISAGTRPTRYYQPLGKLVIPFSGHVAWVSEWRYYGFGESLYAYEAFRTHLMTTGLRFTR